jgi:hypothetical protein
MSNKEIHKTFWYGPPEEIERRRIIEAIQSSPSETYDMLMKLIRTSFMIENSITVNNPSTFYDNKKGKSK